MGYFDACLFYSKLGIIIIVFPGSNDFLDALSMLQSYKIIVFNAVIKQIGFQHHKISKQFNVDWQNVSDKVYHQKKAAFLIIAEILQNLQVFPYGKIRRGGKGLSSESSIYSIETVLISRLSLLHLQKILTRNDLLQKPGCCLSTTFSFRDCNLLDVIDLLSG